MSYKRKFNRANEQKTNKEKSKEKKLWYVRSINYKDYVIEQNRGHQIILMKDGKEIARKDNISQPISNMGLKMIVNEFINLQNNQSIVVNANAKAKRK